MIYEPSMGYLITISALKRFKMASDYGQLSRQAAKQPWSLLCKVKAAEKTAPVAERCYFAFRSSSTSNKIPYITI